MNEFDIKAADWDNNPMHNERSAAIANYIIRLIPINKNMSALEYGAGTGTTSFLLINKLKEITMMDSSPEMVKKINEKIREANINNMKALKFDLEHDDYKNNKFDLIFTQMVLHHVTDITPVLFKFSKLLNKGGYLTIADLYKEDGSFHGTGFNGHNGFEPEVLIEMLKKNSFRNISYIPCFTIEKKISENETRKFEVFLLIARIPN